LTGALINKHRHLSTSKGKRSNPLVTASRQRGENIKKANNVEGVIRRNAWPDKTIHVWNAIKFSRKL